MASSSFFHPNFIIQMQNPNEEKEDPLNLHHQSSILNPFFPIFSPQDFSTVSFSGKFEGYDAEEEVSDECLQAGEKKRRLNVEQARTLEKNFELGNKLEAERKMQLAMSLGLRPRQIAIWFQNRRARGKTKQLEKDYDLLKLQFQAIQTENGALRAQNKKLQAEILSLKGREAAELINLKKETEGSRSNKIIKLFSSIRQPTISEFLHGSSAPDLNCVKIENGITDEHLSNLLYGMETSFWPWPDHQNHH